ncbi:phosphate ABC transporter substrate-binding protein [Candidatus Fermentibacteria bacterium]|nr:phosphate ABC transporter substrate-binding protein [Candidatus Fermentibacteria bacterium]
MKAGTVLLAVGAALLLPMSARSSEITVVGSTTVQPLAELLAEAYQAVNPGVIITVSGGGSSVGVTSAGNGLCDVGMASREIKESERQEFPSMAIHVIARDGIAIVTNPGVGVTNLSKSQVRDIFTGDITNWSEVGGPDQDIVVVSREEGSGTRAAFEEMVMEGVFLITGAAVLQPSNGAVVTTVASTPYSIAYISFGYMNESVAAVSVNGIAPTAANASAGRYPIVRPLCMLTPGTPQGDVKAWLDFIMSPDGQAIVSDEGYLPVQ